MKSIEQQLLQDAWVTPALAGVFVAGRNGHGRGRSIITGARAAFLGGRLRKQPVGGGRTSTTVRLSRSYDLAGHYWPP